jgi:hypothetical protein
MVSENRVFRKILGPRREEVVGGWRKLHNEELHQVSLRCSIPGGLDGLNM